jgi:hypothetical protein
MTTLIETLAAVTAGTLVTSAFARTPKEIRRASPLTRSAA